METMVNQLNMELTSMINKSAPVKKFNIAMRPKNKWMNSNIFDQRRLVRRREKDLEEVQARPSMEGFQTRTKQVKQNAHL